MRIIQAVVDSYPRGFWRDLYDRISGAYADLFLEVKNDARTLDLQRMAQLQQIRPFRIDFEMTKVAETHGISCSINEVPNNRWRHAYAVAGSLGITQSYVQAYGEFPPPARFREGLSEASRLPTLAFDNDGEFNDSYEFYGLVTHTPIGRRFDERSCMLGSAQLCVPHPGMEEWAAIVGLPELVAQYPSEQVVEKVSSKGPRFKTQQPTRQRGTGT